MHIPSFAQTNCCIFAETVVRTVRTQTHLFHVNKKKNGQIGKINFYYYIVLNRVDSIHANWFKNNKYVYTLIYTQ